MVDFHLFLSLASSLPLSYSSTLYRSNGGSEIKISEITKLTSSQFHLVFVGRGSLIDETNYKYYETLLLLFPLRKVNTNENTIPRCL
jgi:hypothetical protein